MVPDIFQAVYQIPCARYTPSKRFHLASIRVHGSSSDKRHHESKNYQLPLRQEGGSQFCFCLPGMFHVKTGLQLSVPLKRC